VQTCSKPAERFEDLLDRLTSTLQDVRAEANCLNDGTRSDRNNLQITEDKIHQGELRGAVGGRRFRTSKELQCSTKRCLCVCRGSPRSIVLWREVSLRQASVPTCPEELNEQPRSTEAIIQVRYGLPCRQHDYEHFDDGSEKEPSCSRTQ